MRDDPSKAEGHSALSKVNDQEDGQTQDLSKGNTFPKFMELPPELRIMIWKQCLPKRIVTPWYYGGSVKRPRTIPIIAHVCCEAKQVVFSQGDWKQALLYVDESDMDDVDNDNDNSDDNNDDDRDIYRKLPCWYNEETDVIYLESPSDDRPVMFPESIDGSYGNEILILAAHKPDTSLLVSTSVEQWFTNTFIQNLYETFLKPRTHFFLELWRVEIRVRGLARQKAFNNGLLGFPGDQQSAIVDASDTGLLVKYLELLDLEPCVSIPERICGDLFNGLDEIIVLGGCKPGSYMHKGVIWFMEALFKCVCKLALPHITDDETNGMVDHVTGKLNKDHPLVVQLDLTQPRWTPVVVFQVNDGGEAIVSSTKKEQEEASVTEGLPIVDEETRPQAGEVPRIDTQSDENEGEFDIERDLDAWRAVFRQPMRMREP